MQIIGNGFLARNLDAAFGERFPEVTALAAGVSSTSVTDAAAFDREAEVLYAALRGCVAQGRTLLYFSTASFAMYGHTAAPATEDGPLFPPSAYGRHKLALEACVRASGARHVVLRLSHVVGPHQRPHQLLPAIVRQVGSGTVTVYRGAHRDLLDARDLMHVIDRILVADPGDVVVNVASGRPLPVEEIVDGVAARLGAAPDRVYSTGPLARTEVSLERLRALVPDFGTAGPVAPGDPGYLGMLLDRYLDRPVAAPAR
ncbi:NAD-dependent epimerase/dehydratase family protein [Dactylosporangium aurantiacum]|uniref:NAD-dependent epimerase/dehydratase family protein n=1 Tax=Dactylosporangium aurantiacum TaxID=35754 RepID=A0A9Q9IAT1_9ACTN|nr:NAD(P)-dependent oxidoreductase [Dactylosporangium aurantiacum]MDG6106855.1 NAD(P)-dependent oxidoreductase [Dactylosporangium aurantiacum]UWZ50990.1 NAD-dependent epimerase/dehydratase family protein [Dactylosporangium aurantiacum]